MLKIYILSFYYHLKDFNLLFLQLVKFCLCDTYIQSYILSKLIKKKKDNEKHNNFKIILFISAKLPCVTCGEFSQNASHLFAIKFYKFSPSGKKY